MGDSFKINLDAIKLGEISDFSNKISWNSIQFKKQILKRINYFKESKIKANDSIILLNGNTAFFFADLIALWHLGCNAIPLSFDIATHELIKNVSVSNSKLIIIEEVTEQFKDLNLPFLKTLKEENLDNKEVPIEITIAPEAALTLFTSGTTGIPRGIHFQIKKIIAKIELIIHKIGIENLGRTLCFLPTSFGHGLIANSLTALFSGNKLVILKPLTIDSVMEFGYIIDQEEITFLSSVPSAWRLITKYSNSPKRRTLKKIFCASAPLDEKLWCEVNAWSGCEYVCNVYGITECLSWIAGDTQQTSFNLGSLGTIWTGEIKILKEDNSFGEIEEEGEILIKNQYMFQAYAYNDSDYSKQYFEQGYFKTNDIGKLNSKNELVLLGRKGSRINKGGVKIYPEEIDIIIQESGLVSEVCSFGIPHEIAGEIVAVAIVKSTNSEMSDEEVVKKVKEWLVLKLQRTKMPNRFYIVDLIPKTNRGKLDRKSIAKLLNIDDYFV